MSVEWERLRQWRALSDNAVRMDRWDRLDWVNIHKNMEGLRDATGDLVGTLPTGEHLMTDVFTLLHKVAPDYVERDDMKPEAWINHAVATEAPKLSDWTTLRRFTRGDPVASALACVNLEPDLETLADRQRQRQAKAQRLQELLDRLTQLQEEKVDVDTMVERWAGEHDDDEPLPDELAAQVDKIAKDLQEQEDDVEEAADELDQAQTADAASVRARLATAVRDAADAAKLEAAVASLVWGTAPGDVKRLPVEPRLALARKLNNDRLRRIAEKFGAIHNLSMTDRLRRNPLMADELVGVTLGRDLTRVLPSELAKLHDPRRRHEFYRDYAQGRLLEFEYDGEERATKGGIIVCEDGSISMHGEREHWAKAFMANWMDIARQEGRQFCLIHFGGKGQAYVLDFPDAAAYTTDRIFEALEIFCNGGTDFETPLTLAAERLRSEYQSTGRVSGDVLMLTDGECAVGNDWLRWYHEEADTLGFRTFPVVIGHNDSRELRRITGRTVANVRDLAGGTDIRHLFQEI